MSGCSGRAVAYIGILEVFEENKIPVDMIAACSSATLVACAYASGNMQKLKEKYFSITRKEILEFFEPTFKGGIFSLERVDLAMDDLVNVENLEELRIPITLVASDIIEGKEVHITMGNVMRAIKASCAFPGLFEPVVWGDKVLIDGGLFSIVPIEAAKSMGPDLVLGIDMYTRRNLFENSFLGLRRGYNFFKSPFYLVGKAATSVKNHLFKAAEEVMTINEIKSPNFLTVLGKSLDYAIAERKKGEHFNCDLMLEPDVLDFSGSDLKIVQQIYEAGRNCAEAALPRIKQLLDD